jgi:hypothetical protein
MFGQVEFNTKIVYEPYTSFGGVNDEGLNSYGKT